MGYNTGGLAENVAGDVGKNLEVISPLSSPSGKKGALYFPNNIMIYKNNTNIKGTEAFLTYYYQNMAPLWTENTGIGLPPLVSIARPRSSRGQEQVKIIEEWQPISKTGPPRAGRPTS